MAKFINSQNAIPTDLLLWNELPTQVSIQEKYNIKVWPVTNILNDGPINFNVPPQPKGMLTDINIVTKFKIQKDGHDMTVPQKNLSIVNNFANALWGLVDVKVDDRLELTQSMRNSYAYQTFFNHALNSESNRQDYLLYNELFKMDQGVTKDIEESTRTIWASKDAEITAYVDTRPETSGKVDFSAASYPDWWDTPTGRLTQYQRDTRDQWNTYVDSIQRGKKRTKAAAISELQNSTAWWESLGANPAANERIIRSIKGDSVTVFSKLQCPLFNTSKCLPTNMKIRISLIKNSNAFLLLTDESSNHTIYIEDVYLNVVYFRPRDQILNIIEERLQKDPAPYFVSRPEIIIKPITQKSKIIRLTDIFHEKLPPYAFFCLQKSADFEGKLDTNPFTFVPFKKFQFYVNGSPYFIDALEVSNIENGIYEGFGDYLRQLYRTIGKDLKGDCLINTSNYQLNFIVGMSFGADKSSTTDKHLNLQENATTYLEIDMGIKDDDVPGDMILITYAVYDRQIQIDGNRSVRIIE